MRSSVSTACAVTQNSSSAMYEPSDANAMGATGSPSMSGKRSGVPVKGLTATNPQPEAEIRRAVVRDGYDLVVLGTSLRRGDTKFLGPRTLALARSLRRPVLLVMR